MKKKNNLDKILSIKGLLLICLWLCAAIFLQAQSPFAQNYSVEIFRPSLTKYVNNLYLNEGNLLKGATFSAVYDTLIPSRIVKKITLLEGDMVFSEEMIGKWDNTNSLYQTRWQYSAAHKTIVVPYLIDKQMLIKERDKVNEAISYFNSVFNGRIKFVPQTKESDVVVFVQTLDSYSSWVGKKGGEQFIEIATNPKIGSILHEMGHAVGLFHEHQRNDSDAAIRILSQNIIAQNICNFDKIETYSQSTPYDYNSLMHPACDAFTIQPSLNVNGVILNGFVTLQSKHDMGNAKMGQRGYTEENNKQMLYYTPSDIKDILDMYPHIQQLSSMGDNERYTCFIPNGWQTSFNGIPVWERISTTGTSSIVQVKPETGDGTQIIIPKLNKGETLRAKFSNSTYSLSFNK